MKPAFHCFLVAANVFLFAMFQVRSLCGNEREIPESTPPGIAQANADADVNTIPWSVLAPEKGRPFFDPFAKLSNDQIADLGFIDRVRRLISQQKIKADGKDAREAAELADRLAQQGVDVTWLMAQRERVHHIRAIQVESTSQSIAKSLQDQRVTLAGYVIPLDVAQGRLTEFFLVPTLAACSHEDAPPRLQVVLVSTEKGIPPPSRSTPVRVTGTVIAGATSRSTINGNGRLMVHSAYVMRSPEIEAFQPNRPTN